MEKILNVMMIHINKGRINQDLLISNKIQAR